MQCPKCESDNVASFMVDANVKSKIISRYVCRDCGFVYQVSINSKRQDSGGGGGLAGPVDLKSMYPSDVVPCDRCGLSRATNITVDPKNNKVRRLCLNCKIYAYPVKG